MPTGRPSTVARAPRAHFALAAPLAGAVVLVLAVAACAGGGLFASPTPTPRPDQPCQGAAEQRGPGFYPALEALVPREIDGVPPTQRDSGRWCSAAKLGILMTKDGLKEVHFAGAIWPSTDRTTGVSAVVYAAPGLTTDMVADSFAVAAGDASNVTRVLSDRVTIAGRPGVRLDVTNQDGTQVVVCWPSAMPGTINIVLGSEVTDRQIQDAIAAFGRR